MRLSNNWSDTLYVESARGKDMTVVATGGFKLFLTCLQPSKRKNESSNQKQFSSNRTHTRNLNQPKRVVSDVTVLSGLLYAVMSVCRHTCFASSANESFWALTLECPKDIYHVPPFLHGLVLPLAHSSMSEKKKTMGAWSVSLLWCIFLKGLIANLCQRWRHIEIFIEKELYFRFRCYSQVFTSGFTPRSSLPPV